MTGSINNKGALERDNDHDRLASVHLSPFVEYPSKDMNPALERGGGEAWRRGGSLNDSNSVLHPMTLPDIRALCVLFRSSRGFQ